VKKYRALWLVVDQRKAWDQKRQNLRNFFSDERDHSD